MIIDQLPVIQLPIQDTDEIAIERGQLTYKAGYGDLLSPVKSALGIVEDTNTATHTIAKGQFVIWKDALYIASAAIPVGTTLSTSNLTAVSNGGLNAIIESGYDGGWSYHKFADHTYHAWFVGLKNFATGTAWLGGYFHALDVGLFAPSFSQGITSLSAVPTGAQLFMCVGASIGKTSNVYLWDAVSGAETNKPIRLDMYGTW